MRFVQDSPLELGYRVWQLRPPQPSLTVAVKGTFEVREGAPAVFAEEQLPVSGERYVDDDVERPLREPSDLSLLKPRGEAMVVGQAHTGGEARTAVSCRFAIGPIEKRFVVFGDRCWERGIVAKMTEPVPFTAMDLDMTRAYGGPGFAANPYGRGRAAIMGEDGEARVWLPNVERDGQLVDAPNATPAPVVLGPLPVTWPARLALAGTYDGDYARERWPWLPKDFDPSFFLEAPEDQRLPEGWFRGDEVLELEGLHPAYPELRARLPAIAPRVLVDLTRPDAEPGFEEVGLRLDTVVWDGELARLCCVWRGRLDVSSDDLEEVRSIYVAHDPLAGPHRPASTLAARCVAILEAENAEEEEAEGEAPPLFEEATGEDDDEATAEMEVLDLEADMQTLHDDDGAFDELEAEDTAVVRFPPADDEEDEIARLEAKLAELGIPSVDDLPIPEVVQPSPRELLEALRATGAEIPESLEQTVAESEAEDDEPEADEVELPEDPADPLEGRALVESRLAEGLDLRRLDLTEADLSGLDLSRQDLEGSVLRGAKLREANLTQARIRDCVLADADLFHATVGAADAGEADFTGADLTGVDFVNSVLEGCDFTGARMVSVRLSSVRAGLATFTGADLSGSQLASSDFREADFEGANLTGIDAAGSNFTDAVLEGATADRARFDGATLVQVRAEGLHAEEARFSSVHADDSFWEGAHLVRAVFVASRLSRADFSGATLLSAELDQCVLREARFEGALLHSLRARRADLFEASLEGADLRFADLRGASLYGANLQQANVEDANLELADLAMTVLAR